MPLTAGRVPLTAGRVPLTPDRDRQPQPPAAGRVRPGRDRLRAAAAERRYARAILERAGNNQSAAARALGISRNKLARLLRG